MSIRLGAKESLSQTLKLFKGRTAYQMNQLHQTSGSIWYPGFHDRMIRSAEDLAGYFNYVRFNPVKAKLVSASSDWPCLLIKDEIYELL